MDLANQPELTNPKPEAERVRGHSAPAPARRGKKAETPEITRRRQFYSQTRAEAMLALGESVETYLDMMESLRADLQPAPGYEELLVDQMGETVWEMRRAQRMREGLAVRRIQSQKLGEQVRTVFPAHQAIQNLEPFERLQTALKRRRGGPTAEEIDAFIASRQHDTSPRMQEFIELLKSLSGEGPGRKAALRQARAQLRELMEPYMTTAWSAAADANKVDSAENLAALAAPEGEEAVNIHKMEDLCLRRLWRLTRTLASVREGALKKKNLTNEAAIYKKTKHRWT